MLNLIIKKELRDIIGSTKFVVTFAVCAVLIILTFYVAGSTYQLNRSRYEAAKTENLRHLEGITDWIMVRDHRIFLPPNPLATLVSGVANDIGRTVNISGSGETTAYDSRFNNDPILAVFRFLDLTFIFQIVLSLFAILFAYDAINGEKERGTLKLTFANALPRTHYILGKVIGAYLALALPLAVPLLIGCLILPFFGIQFSAEQLLRFALILCTGLLYFGAFLLISIFLSTVTKRSASAFLLSLVVWVFAVLIIPRTAVLLAGRSVPVPSVDEIASKKNSLQRQLWTEHRKAMLSFKSTKNSDNPDDLLGEFQKYMSELNDKRDKETRALAEKLNEERHNWQVQQHRLAMGLASFSPAASFSLAAMNLAGTTPELKDHYLREAQRYQESYAEFMREKTGMNPGGAMIIRIDDDEEKKAIDPLELPVFSYREISISQAMHSAMPNIALLVLFNVLFFAGAFVAFLRFDLR